jgi:hypothetical protein
MPSVSEQVREHMLKVATLLASGRLTSLTSRARAQARLSSPKRERA